MIQQFTKRLLITLGVITAFILGCWITATVCWVLVITHDHAAAPLIGGAAVSVGLMLLWISSIFTRWLFIEPTNWYKEEQW